MPQKVSATGCRITALWWSASVRCWVGLHVYFGATWLANHPQRCSQLFGVVNPYLNRSRLLGTLLQYDTAQWLIYDSDLYVVGKLVLFSTTQGVFVYDDALQAIVVQFKCKDNAQRTWSSVFNDVITMCVFQAAEYTWMINTSWYTRPRPFTFATDCSPSKCL